MKNFNIINLTKGKTFIHQLSGTTKVRLFAALMVYVMMSFDLPIILPLFIFSIIGLISLKPSWKTIRPIIFFVVFLNVLNIILYWLADPHCGFEYTADKTVLFAYTNYLVVTRGTLWFLLVRLLKMLTAFSTSLVFIMSITPSELAAGLTSLGFTYKLGSIVEIAFRYIPDISRDYENIAISMQCRGLELDAKKTKAIERLKQMVIILIPLIITSFDRVGNISNAMDLRGFGKGKKRSYYSEYPERRNDKIFKLIYCLIALFCAYYIISGLITPRVPKMWIYWRCL
ncbi:MAG: energy-coupling factor transporter transmembrane protein EcfT [Erysipelotrichia bacterium]|nr:energy-coupling factor transporter transmembrane protein EcfT [Erysipelotrichia bacterium]